MVRPLSLNETDTTRWFRRQHPAADAPSRLYCVPFAGGGPTAFRAWQHHLPNTEIWAVHLPGRESRMLEPAFTDMDALMDVLLPAFTNHATEPFSIFGHSMGAMVAFELVRRLEASSGIRPQHLFVSGHGAPSVPANGEHYHELSHDAFVDKIRSFEGTPEAVLQHEELLEIFVPLLRADIALLETYSPDPASAVDTAITAFSSHADPEVPVAAMESWRFHTHGGFDFHTFAGGHFFWQTDPAPMLNAIRAALTTAS